MQRVDWHNRRSGTGVDAEFANYDVLRLLATSEYNAIYVQSVPTPRLGVGPFFASRKPLVISLVYHPPTAWLSAGFPTDKDTHVRL